LVYYDNKEFNTEIEYEVYILNKYLSKYYGEDKALKLITANKNDIDKLAKALGAKDIAFFCLYFMSDIFVVKDSNVARELSESHHELWEIANDVFVNDTHDKLNIICPRGFAKTTIFDLAISIWLHCYKKSIFTLIGAKTDTDSVQFLDSIKKVLGDNKKITKCFGRLIDNKKFKSNANELELTNNTYIRTVGSGTSVRGANWGGIRPTVFIGDDFQDEKNILTDDAREKQYNKWTKEIEQVGDKAVYRNGKKIKSATKIIAIGTVLHIDCLMSKLSRNNDYYTILKRAILLEDGQKVDDIFESDLWLECKKIYFDDKLRKEERKSTAEKFYKDNIDKMKFPILWEEKWDCFNDLAIPYWENRRSFMSELMNDATSIGEKWFKSVRTQTSKEIESHKFIKTMLCIDPASTTNKKSDYTAMGVGSKADNDFTYVRDLVMKKLSFNEYCKTAVDLLVDWKDITHISVEKNTFNGSDVLKMKELIANDPRLRGRAFEWINKMQKKNKDEKISTIIDPINNGQIIINGECEDSSAAVEQLMDFQGQQYSVHDDFVDMLAELNDGLKEIKTRGVIRLLDRRVLGI
jgi:phage terminase large subunit-like protein